jgi:hypothetical protein
VDIHSQESFGKSESKLPSLLEDKKTSQSAMVFVFAFATVVVEALELKERRRKLMPVLLLRGALASVEVVMIDVDDSWDAERCLSKLLLPLLLDTRRKILPHRLPKNARRGNPEDCMFA